MSVDLEDRVRALFTTLAANTPVEPRHTFDPNHSTVGADGGRPGPGRRWLALAASIVLVASAVVALLSRRAHDGDDEPPATRPSVAPSVTGLWLPNTADGSVRITGYSWHEAPSVSQGAVIAPDGTVFGLSVNVPTNITSPPRDHRAIGDFDVEAVTDGTAPAEIYRTIWQDCVAVGITTAGEDMWSADTTALVDGLSIDGSAVRFDLPGGWTLLGANRWYRQYGVTLEAHIDGTDYQLGLFQMPAGSVGFYLDAMESAPRQVEIAGTPGWLVEGVTTKGSNTLVGSFGSTAFSLSGELPAEELIRIAESMTPTDASAWSQPSPQSQPSVTPASVASNCANPTLQIVSAG